MWNCREAAFRAVVLFSAGAMANHWTCRWHALQTHDIFINYRVATDADLAEKFALSLNGETKTDGTRISVFLDKRCLNVGEDWEVGFLNGIAYAKLIVLLISAGAIERIKQADSKQDNVLLEYEQALERLEKKEASVLPVLIGRFSEDGGYHDFAEFDTSVFPDAPHYSPKSQNKNVRATMTALFRLQGIRCNPHHYEDNIPVILQIANKVSAPPVNPAPAAKEAAADGEELKDDLYALLATHHVESYVGVMRSNGFTLDVLSDMTHDDQEAMEVTCKVLPGHKVKFRKLFAQLEDEKKKSYSPGRLVGAAADAVVAGAQAFMPGRLQKKLRPGSDADKKKP
jgi:hypothetical protein